MTEAWRAIPSTNGRYEASSEGRIRSTHVVRLGGKVLHPTPHHRVGYASVSVYQNGRRKSVNVHLLVAEAFHGPRPDPAAVVRHLNGDASDCRAANLRWGTGSENERDRIEHGTHNQTRKTHCPQGHAYSPENTHVYRGARRCRECRRVWQRGRGPRIRAALNGGTQ